MVADEVRGLLSTAALRVEDARDQLTFAVELLSSPASGLQRAEMRELDRILARFLVAAELVRGRL